IGATGRRLGWALGALLATGTLLVAAEPTRELPNAALRLKIALLVPVIAYALWQRRRLARAEPAAAPRIATAVSLALWVVVVGLGRWIAYA
ncbi:MAG TPA: hypothetical protein VFF94_06450, partial [Novosphingobium sp.]|nr:hypothetical protein [Novosphingobium sp.]